ncbi:MAG: glycosyltransferase, partial [Prevotella sp.]
MLNLSIIIPVYNVEAYIEECLASVVAQSDAKAN